MLPSEAGIGKTALWLAGVNAAADRGYRILSSRPSEAETQLSFAGLTDLLGGAGDVAAALPPVQRQALEAALLLSEPEIHINDRAVAAAFLEALRRLARDGPVCLAVDDIQWMDAASLAALHYALARLEGKPVAALLAVRGDVPGWLRRAVREDRRSAMAGGGRRSGMVTSFRVALGCTGRCPVIVFRLSSSSERPVVRVGEFPRRAQRGAPFSPFGQDLR